MTFLSKAQVAALNRDKVVEVLEGLGWRKGESTNQGTDYLRFDPSGTKIHEIVVAAEDFWSDRHCGDRMAHILNGVMFAEGVSPLDAYLLLTGQKLIDGEELAKLKATRTRRSVEAAKTIHGILSTMSPLSLYWAFLELGDDAKWRGFWEGLVGESYETLKERLSEKAARDDKED